MFKLSFLKISIRTKFLLILVLLTGSFIFITNYIWSSSVRPILLEKAIQAQVAEAEKLSFRIRNFIEAKKIFIVLLSRSVPFLQKQITRQPHELQIALTQDADILEIAVLDQTGQELTRVTRDKVYGSKELVDRSGDLAYQFAIHGDGLEYYSAVFYENNEPMMMIAVPVESAETQRRLETISTAAQTNERQAFLTREGIMVVKVSLKNLDKSLIGVRLDDLNVNIISQEGFLIGTKRGLPGSQINLQEQPLVKYSVNSQDLTHSMSVLDIEKSQEEVYATYSKIADVNWLVIVEQPVSEIFADLNNINQRAIIILFSSIALALFLAQIISSSMTKPIKQLSVAAKFIGQGDFTKRVTISTQDELADLGETFNLMATLIQKQIEDLKGVDKLKDEFMALVSHNLLTPLTIIKDYALILQNDKELKLREIDFVSKFLLNIGILERLIQEVLSISSIRAGGMKLHIVSTDMNTLITNAVSGVDLKAKSKNITINMSLLSSNSVINLDASRMQEVLANLLDNAVKFSNQEGKIEVMAVRDQGYIRLAIKDNGVGIDEAVATTLFQKFHRGTDYLQYDYQGIGLGLYFCKLIIETHQGKISFESKKGIGTTFFLWIPTNLVLDDPSITQLEK